MEIIFTFKIPATDNVKLDVYVTTMYSAISIKNAIIAPIKTEQTTPINSDLTLVSAAGSR